MIYFDNSATTAFKPKSVLGAVQTTITHLSANPGRGSHVASIKCASLVYSARKCVADFIGLCDPSGIIFTPNCSHALNLAIMGTIKKGHVITTCFEHNSVLRPLFNYAQPLGCNITILEPRPSFPISAKQVENAIRHDTVCCIINHVSNVTGEVADVESIGRVCKKHGIIFIVDGAQSVGKIPIKMKEWGINLLAIAPHKGLHAITGVGVLAVNGTHLQPILFGGTGTSSLDLTQPTDMPEGFEVGTLPLPAIASLIPAIKWTEKNGEKIKNIEHVSRYLLNSLASISRVRLYTATDNTSGVVSFNVDGYSSYEVCDYLSCEYGICTRCGLHCAPLTHKYLRTLSSGTVRVSVGVDNTEAEADTLIAAIKRLG